MTGHGSARHEQDGLSAAVDIRTVNSRFFKLNIRGFESSGSLDAKIESRVRKRINRATVNVHIRVESVGDNDAYRINTDVLLSYARQIQNLSSPGISFDSSDILLTLPGIVTEPDGSGSSDEHLWEVIEQALAAALDDLQTMRLAEGQAMAKDLEENSQAIAEHLTAIERRSPEVVTNYQKRLRERIQESLNDLDVKITPADLIREVGIFAERCDISEETVRLRSHMDQFKSITNSPEGSGRKLDFLIQEMFRETNTIGSKANDAPIAQHVVEIKTRIERMREMIQNVE